jgi:hypothetical protein
MNTAGILAMCEDRTTEEAEITRTPYTDQASESWGEWEMEIGDKGTQKFREY